MLHTLTARSYLRAISERPCVLSRHWCSILSPPDHTYMQFLRDHVYCRDIGAPYCHRQIILTCNFCETMCIVETLVLHTVTARSYLRAISVRPCVLSRHWCSILSPPDHTYMQFLRDHVYCRDIGAPYCHRQIILTCNFCKTLCIVETLVLHTVTARSYLRAISVRPWVLSRHWCSILSPPDHTYVQFLRDHVYC